MRRPPAAAPAAVLLAALALAACDRKGGDEAPPPVRPALSLVVRPAARNAVRSLTGTVEPRYQSQLGFQATGRMTSRDVNVGDRVAKGQRLATLDPTVPRLAVQSAKADLANAQAALVNAEAGNRRQQELIKTDSVSQAQVDSAQAARDTAAARVRQAEASLQKAQEQLGYTVLSCGYDGVVASWTAEVGQVVTSGQTVVTVARPDARDGVFDVPDDLVERFAPGARFTVALLADPAVTASATAREVSPMSDAATRTRRVRLTLEGAGEAFRLGTIVTTAVAGAPGPSVVTVPDTAVLERDGGSVVWIIGPDGRLAARPVALGPARDGAVPVLSGLAEGDRVLTAGVHSVTDGQAVTIAND